MNAGPRGASVELAHVSVRYRRRPHGSRRRRFAAHRAGRTRGLARAVGLREEHAVTDDEPSGAARRRHDRHRRPRRGRRRSGRAAPRDRVCDPSDRFVSAHDDRGEHRHRSRAFGLGPRAHRRPRRRAARVGQARSCALSRASAARVVGRRTATRRGGAGARGRAAPAPDGRTVRRGRRDRAASVAGRDLAHPSRRSGRRSCS